MLADLGTKALHAPRLEKLKEPMSMGTIKEEEKEDEVEERKDEEKKEKEMKNWAEAAQAVRLITMAAAISTAKAVEEEEKLDDGWPESEKDVFQAALRMVVVKDSR